ncbi:MAG: hypothetical protein QOI38_2923 [Sphingomonadales bacterium]|jgi:uncharacterized protein YegJ (DUF2314 family)|nr:hypothetical protein [Sphingomonadales bacterium]
MIDFLVAAALALASAPPAGADQAEEQIYQVRSDDAAMNAAIAEGRRTLPSFYRRLAAPQAGDGEFMVKFDIDPSDQFEYVWAVSLDRSGSPMTGILINQPVNTSDRPGDRVAIPEASIIDWGYRAGRVMQGNFTNRVLLGQMAPEDAAEYRRFLGW